MIEIADVLAYLSLAAGLANLFIFAATFGKFPLGRGFRIFFGAMLLLGLFIATDEILEHRWPNVFVVDYGNLARVFFATSWGLIFYMGLLELSDRESREAKEKYRALVETSHDWIWEMDAKGRVTYSSPAAKSIIGYDPEEIIGKTPMDFMPPEEAELCVERLRSVMQSAQPFAGMENVNLHKDGRPLVFETAGVPFFDAGGALLGYRGVNHDVTRRKETEQALLLAKRELELQNLELKKIATIKDNLIRDVSHELKTPVAKISMQLELLRDRLGACMEEDEGMARIFSVMEASLRRQEMNIRNILDLARLEGSGRKYVFEKFPLDGLVREVIEDFRLECETQGIVLTDRLSEIRVTSDRSMLWHALSNLVGNAIKFRRQDSDHAVEIYLEHLANGALLKVSDNGLGIAPPDRERVFERFYKANPSIEGSGVGLSISRMILEDLGGTIAIESPGRGSGTTVIVRLPLIPPRRYQEPVPSRTD